MPGVISCGAYVPHHRLDLSAIAEVLGDGRGRGLRAVACYDEDTTTMGVEAARLALAAAPVDTDVTALYFATTSPAYAEKTNATAIHAALGLRPEASAIDVNGAIRSGAGALRVGLHARETSLVVLSDVCSGRPGGAAEREGGDGAAALVVTGDDGPVIAELVADAALSEEFLDRWRTPDQTVARRWEEHFGGGIYAELGRRALQDALGRAGVDAAALDHLVVAGASARAAKGLAAASGVAKEAVAPDLSGAVGNTGAAHAGLLLSAVLERAQPGELIALVVLADGAEVFILRATELLASWKAARPVVAQIEAGSDGLPYGRFLAWRGVIAPEPSRRPAPQAPAAPASRRGEAWKLGLSGSRCGSCDTLHLPPQRVCHSCRAIDGMTLERVADRQGTVVTASVDRLAWSLSAPATFAVVDLDGGGRMQLEVTEVADPVAPGQRVDLTFRRMYTQSNIHNYFWKARPAREEAR